MRASLSDPIGSAPDRQKMAHLQVAGLPNCPTFGQALFFSINLTKLEKNYFVPLRGSFPKW